MFSIEYAPEMSWQSRWGPFESDVACIGLYTLSGDRIPERMVYEWRLPPAGIAHDGADRAEIKAFTDTVRAFLVHPPEKPISVEVGWTLNDYQIDVAKPEGRTEYKRVIDTASALGIQTLLYAPANSDLARFAQDADDWNWEHVLWLGLGQKIRQGEWDPAGGEIPASISEMLAYSAQKKIGLLAYVYPSLPFSQNPDWLVKNPKKATKNQYATLASRDFQDFLLGQLLTFKKRTGIAGYSFDYTFLNLPGSSSYAQWRGWRRVLESLRKAEPGILIDGRQTYQSYGPWSWLGGSYPHPTGNDEQAESFTPFPDLDFDRVSADRARFVNYWYRNYQFAPEEIIPGYMTHQTERSINIPPDELTGGHPARSETVYTAYRRRDWDFLGFKYSVISSIATGGWNNVMDMIPGRDVAEFEAFAKSQDKTWIRHWLEWTAENKEYLRNTQSILGPPAIGRADGTSALVGDHGYLFIFNPNFKRIFADFNLDASIGLIGGKNFVLREVYPQEGKLVGKPGAGIWAFGEHVHLELDGTSATVLELSAADFKGPTLFGAARNSQAPAQVDEVNGTIQLRHISGEPGSIQEIGVLLPEGASANRLEVNGRAVNFQRNGQYLFSALHFAGERFAQSQQVSLKPDSAGTLSGTFLVPRRVFEGLAEIVRAWPIPWQQDDYRSTWLVPGRLLLFAQFAEPKDTMDVSATLDGEPLRWIKAYSSVRAHSPSFVGFYAELSKVKPDTKHALTLKFPPALAPQFQGIFFDHVEPAYTEDIAP